MVNREKERVREFKELISRLLKALLIEIFFFLTDTSIIISRINLTSSICIILIWKEYKMNKFVYYKSTQLF